jgi:hypothetical protein
MAACHVNKKPHTRHNNEGFVSKYTEATQQTVQVMQQKIYHDKYIVLIGSRLVILNSKKKEDIDQTIHAATVAVVPFILR